jgi:hypothetical protein
VKNHVTGAVAKGGIKMGGTIIENLNDGFGSIFGSLGLFGRLNLYRISKNKK